MDEKFVGGDILTIPQSVLNNAEELDRKINRIANDSEKMATHFNSAMTRMSDGTDGLLNKLKTIQGIIDNIGGIRIEGMNGMAQTMSVTATEAEKVATGITKASVAVNQFGRSGKNIAELTAEIAAIEEKLTKDEGVKPFKSQQKEVDRLKVLKEELKVQKQSTNEKIDLLQKEMDKYMEAYQKYVEYLQKKIKAAQASARAEEKEHQKNIERRKKDMEEALKMNEKEVHNEIKRINAQEKFEARKRAALQRDVASIEAQEKMKKKAADSEAKAWEKFGKERGLKAEEESQKKTLEMVKEHNRLLEEQARVEKMAAEEDRKRRKEAENTQKKILDYANKLDKQEEEAAKKRKKELEERAAAQAKLDSRFRKINYDKYVSSTEGALRTSEGKHADTYTKRAVAIKNLEAAMKNLRVTDKNYAKDMDRLSAAHRRLMAEQAKVEANFKTMKTTQRKLMDTAGQLTRRFALMFSVSQVMGFLSNIRDVTGEFEKQNTALASILQNKDKADKLFGQIKELAVKSPFQLKELVSYTKQLSAYQFQYEKLFDTTKRLADVSAGLGVSMDRLILAMGQVKASNFLRGTEVRQFTEAGFNILGELAKYYSELEGRMVSVGDVQERVTKRMVAFGDVEEVFKRVTSAGGIFYKMQERQAETIAGQWSNLKDSIDIMFNEIGSSKKGMIKSLIGTIKDLYENWREVAWYMKPAVALLTIWKVTSALVTIGNSKMVTSLLHIERQTKETTASLSKMQKIGNYLKYTFAGLVPVIGIALVGKLIDMYRESTKASRELDRLRESLDELVNSDSGRLEDLVKSFGDLVARYKLSNEGSQERRDIISSLNSTYGEYLDFVVQENTAYEQLEKTYENVIKRMKEKASLQTLEKGYQQIGESYAKQLIDARKDFEEELSKGLKVKGSLFKIMPDQKDIDKLYSLIQQKIRETDTELLEGSREQRNMFQEIIQNYYGKDVSISQDYLKTIPLVDAFLMKKKEEERLNKTLQTSYDAQVKSREAYLALQSRELAYEKEKADISKEANLSKFQQAEKLKEAAKKLELDKIDIKLQFGEISEESARLAKDRIINWGDEFTESFNKKVRDSLKGFTEEDLSKVLISPEDQKAGVSATVKSTIDSWKLQNETIKELVGFKNEGLEIDEKRLANAVKMEELYRKRADFLGIELGYVEKISKETIEYINAQVDDTYHLDLVDSLMSVNQLQDKFNNKKNEALKKLETINIQKQKGMDIDEEELANIYEQLITYDKIVGLLGSKQVYAEKISKATFDSVNAQMGNEYQLDAVDSLMSTIELQDKYNGKYEEALKLQEAMNAQKALGVIIDEDDEKLVEERVKNYDKLRRLLGYQDDDKKKKGRSRSQLTILKNQIELIKRAGREYEKLLAYYKKSEAKNMITDSFRDAFNESGLSIDMDFDISGVIKKIESLPNIAGKEGAKALKEAVAPLKAEVDLKPRKKSLEELNEEVQKSMDSYELSFELQNSGIGKDIIGDIFGFDTFSIKDLENKLKEVEPELEKFGNKGKEIHDKFQKYISEKQDQELKERLERFSEYLSDYTDKIRQVQDEGALDINYANMLFGEGKIDSDQYSEIIKNIVDKVNQEVSSLNLEKFKKSPEYIKAMGDLSAYSARELENMLQKMKQIIASSEGISAEDLKTYQDTISKITEQLEKAKMPWDKTTVAQLRELNKLQKEYNEETANYNDLLDQQRQKTNELKMAKESLAGLKDQKESGNYTFGIDRQIQEQQSNVQNLTKDLGSINGKLNVSSSNISAISSKMGAITGGAGKSLATVDMIIKGVYQSINATIEMFNEVKGLAESFGADTSKGAWSDITIAMNALGEVNNKVMGSWESFKKGDFIGASVKAVGAVFAVVKGINALHDNKREKAIQKQMKLVEKLKETYEDLERAINKAFSMDTLTSTTDKMNRNLEARNKALRESILKEEDKKKTDHDRIKEWEKEIKENQQQIEENNKKLIESLGGLGTDDRIKGAAEEFAQSWLEAYLQVGDGLDGLKKKMNDWLKNAVQKQLLTNLSKQFITPILEEFDKMFDKDSIGGTEMRPEEAKAWKDLYEQKSEQFNEAAKAYLEALKAAGIDLGATSKGDELSGLQRGIQGITEQTAEALAAITESIRFFVADSNMQLKTILNTLINPPIENPFIYELKLQTEQMRMMNSLWSSLTKTKGGVSGKILKVEIV